MGLHPEHVFARTGDPSGGEQWHPRAGGGTKIECWGRVVKGWFERLPKDAGSLRLFRSTHGQREGHAMAQGIRSRTRRARYRQRVGSGGCSGVMCRTATAPTSSTAASRQRHSKQQSRAQAAGEAGVATVSAVLTVGSSGGGRVTANLLWTGQR
jgi:hypothetical protein